MRRVVFVDLCHCVPLIALALIAVTVACNHTPDPCSDPISVPAPYWNPPQDVPPLEPFPILKAPTFQCVAEETLMCVEPTLEVLAHDFLLLLADDEQCRVQYGELVRFIESVPEVPPPPSGAPPLD